MFESDKWFNSLVYARWWYRNCDSGGGTRVHALILFTPVNTLIHTHYTNTHSMTHRVSWISKVPDWFHCNYHHDGRCVVTVLWNILFPPQQFFLLVEWATGFFSSVFSFRIFFSLSFLFVCLLFCVFSLHHQALQNFICYFQMFIMHVFTHRTWEKMMHCIQGDNLWNSKGLVFPG